MPNCGHFHSGANMYTENLLHRLWIFGDSFSDANYTNSHLPVPDPLSWPNQLANKYSVINHSLQGTGPDYALEKLLQQMETTPVEQRADTSVLFFQSEVYRFNLKQFYTHDSQQVSSTKIAAGEMSHTGKQFLTGLFKHLAVDSWDNREQLKLFATVNSLAWQFKQVAYITVADFRPVYSQWIVPAPNMSFVPVDLIKISLCEPEANKQLTDPRPNHFSARTHQYMLQCITAWMENSTNLQLQHLDRVASNV